MHLQTMIRLDGPDAEAVRMESFNRLMTFIFADGPDVLRVERRLLLVAKLAGAWGETVDVRSLSRERLREILKEKFKE